MQNLLGQEVVIQVVLRMDKQGRNAETVILYPIGMVNISRILFCTDNSHGLNLMIFHGSGC